MRVAFFTDGITPYVLGGMQRHSRLMTQYLAEEGFEIIIYHPKGEGDTFSADEICASFPEHLRSKIEVSLFPYKDSGKLPGHYLRAQRQLSRQYLEAYLQSPGADFIYTKGFTGWELLKRRKEHGIKAKVSVKFHGMNMFQKQPDWKGDLSKYMLRPAVRWIMNAADYTFSYGGQITNIIHAQGIPRDRIIEVPAGVDSSWLDGSSSREKGETIRYLFVGRFDRVKGLPEFYKAIQTWKETKLKVEFVFVGDIPADHRLDDARCRYVGLISNAQDLRKVFDEATYLICPSISEGMPNVILEAMSRGVPAIATNVGAMKMLVDESTGYLIESSQIHEIIQGLEWGVQLDSKTYKELSGQCIDRIGAKFTWQILGSKLASHIERITKS